MTALKKYQRLEASALWRDVPGARARDVVMGLREATVVLSDPRSEVPLSQWSLPAIERLNPGQMPARFPPGRDGHKMIGTGMFIVNPPYGIAAEAARLTACFPR